MDVLSKFRRRKKITRYNQYKNDFFNKLNFPFQKGKKILDVGCGPATDAPIFKKEHGSSYYGTDVYKDDNLKKQKISFKLGGLFKIPYPTESFDYVFVHDVLHHIDEPDHLEIKHLAGLKELKRVCKRGGEIVIVEGNRYNPLFYPHMVLMRGHEHFAHAYFLEIIKKTFKKDEICFKFFEAHFYPPRALKFWKFYEFFMEKFVPRQFRAYNAAVIKVR